MMPLDETLNIDIHACAHYHVTITSHLPKGDPKKLLFTTPRDISHAYLHIVDPMTGGAPSPNELFKTVKHEFEVWRR
jgi:hypothetical protein